MEAEHTDVSGWTPGLIDAVFAGLEDWCNGLVRKALNDSSTLGSTRELYEQEELTA